MVRKKRNDLSWQTSSTKIIKKRTSNVGNKRLLSQQQDYNSSVNGQSGLQKLQSQNKALDAQIMESSYRQIQSDPNNQQFQQQHTIKNKREECQIIQKQSEHQQQQEEQLQLKLYSPSQIKQQVDQMRYCLQAQKIQCRNQQIKIVKQYLNQQSSQILCLIGPPGTGKTTVIMQQLHNKDLDKKSIKINAFALKQAHKNKSILEFIQNLSRQVVELSAIIIDQFDQIKNQYSIIQNLKYFYPSCKIITLSNDHISEKLKNKKYVYFLSYTFEQLYTICCQKLLTYKKYYKNQIIKLTARVTLKETGDFRKMIQIMEQGLFNALSRGSKQVDTSDILGYKEDNTSMQQFLYNLSHHQILLWNKIIQTSHQYNLNKQTKNNCICVKMSSSIQNIKKFHRNFGITKLQTEMCLQTYIQMGLLQCLKFKCNIHNAIINRLQIKKYDVVKQCLIHCCYFR